MKFLFARQDLVMDFWQVTDADLLIAPELDQCLGEWLDAVGSLGQDGVVTVASSIVGEAVLANI